MDSLTNLLPEARFVCRIDSSKGAQNFNVADFAALEPAEIQPITTIPTWIGKRSYEGRWWFSRVARHVAYASAWERDVLTYLDYCGDTWQVARDPAIVIPARSDRTPPIRPWLMIQSAAGARALLLPRADSGRTTELAAILAEHAIDVVTVTLPHANEMRLIQWIAGYRFTRFMLPPDVEQGIRDICSSVSGVAETVESANRSLPYDQAALRANVYSQIWRRTISVVDPGALLTDASMVVAA